MHSLKNKGELFSNLNIRAAGFEPATWGSQNHRATMLRYALKSFFHEFFLKKKSLTYDSLRCQEFDLNERHKDFQSFALPLSYPGFQTKSIKPCLIF